MNDLLAIYNFNFFYLYRMGAAASAESWGGGPRGNFGWNGANGAIAAGGVYAGNAGQASSGGGGPHQGGNRGARKGYAAR